LLFLLSLLFLLFYFCLQFIFTFGVSNNYAFRQKRILEERKFVLLALFDFLS